MELATQAIAAAPPVVEAERPRRWWRALRPSLAVIGLMAVVVGGASVTLSIFDRVASVGGAVPGSESTLWLLRRLPEARILEGVGFVLLIFGTGAFVFAAIRIRRESTL